MQVGEQVTAGQVLCYLSNHQNLYIEGRGFKEDAALLMHRIVGTVGLRARANSTVKGREAALLSVSAAKIRQLRRLGLDFHAHFCRRCAGCRKSAPAFNLDQTEPARTERLERIGGAQLGDVHAGN